jgi:predicted Zn finger-like uncharacterized protein
MIAACPKCHTRYRVRPEQLGPEGARLRCSQCSAVFRVRRPDAAGPGAAEPEARPAGAATPVVAAAAEAAPPPASAASPRERGERPRSESPATPEGPRFDRARGVLVASANADGCKQVAEALEAWGLQVLVAHDGVEAILSIQRALPRVVVLDAALPKMFGFQVCELVKRNESLRSIHVVLVGAIHKEDRYRRPPQELYGADVYVEPHDLPGALEGILERLGLPLSGGAAGRPARDRAGDVRPVASPLAPPSAPRPTGPRPLPTPPAAPRRAPAPVEEPGEPVQRPAEAPASAPGAADPLVAERAKAERLARIIVSDIVLYNPEKFEAAARGGQVVDEMRDELEEGRTLFRDRIDARVRDECDFLAEELERVARTRRAR